MLPAADQKVTEEVGLMECFWCVVVTMATAMAVALALTSQCENSGL